MKHIGTTDDYPYLKAIFHAITSGQEGDVVGVQPAVKVGRYRNKNLRYVEYQSDPVQPLLLFVEQNPNTNSAYAARARQGAKIVWVIRKHDNEYLGRIEDGQVYRKDQT